ncbi:hypothetical protein [Virgibacillus dakarensis]|uniref:hypothetical protein n=1 Tax=Virgibacillus dakarensis TaxID=1917889 RepID=UPI000B431DB3|nr:hypothetical protein [Virgibacillus dakarensis]
MHAINKSGEKKLVMRISYSEAHLIREALSLYKLQMESMHGRNSEEDKYIGDLLYEIMNPAVKETIPE